MSSPRRWPRTTLTHGWEEVNTSGVARLTKFYTPVLHATPPHALVQRIYTLVAARTPGLCNFLDAPELEGFLGGGGGADGERLRVVYRTYATLHFVFVVDASESELCVLDLIQVRDPFQLSTYPR